MRRSVLIAILVVLAGAVLAVSAPVAAVDIVFRRPTSALVLDPFRLPAGPYGAGNRGIEYNTAAGDSIEAAALGEVVFAGAVARSLFVTVDHGAGLKSTYGFVGHILVTEGDQVVAGQRVALADGPFHFGVRLDGAYVDPELFFGVRRVSVRLVAHAGESAGDPQSFETRTSELDWVLVERARAAGADWVRTVSAALAARPATLPGGPYGPRTAPD